MKITSISMENFRSTISETYELTEGVNGFLGRMGAGKSSVLEAIIFCLWGTIPPVQSRRIKLDDLIRRTPQRQKTTIVSVSFEQKGKKYQVKRKIERGKGTTYSELRENGSMKEAPNAQRVTELIQTILNTSYDIFVQIIYSGQNHMTLFSSSSPQERKVQVDRLLGLTAFEKGRSTCVRAANLLKNLAFSKREEALTLNQLKAEELEALKTSIDQLSSTINENEKQLKERENKQEELKKKWHVQQELQSRLYKLERELIVQKTIGKNIKEDIGEQKPETIEQLILTLPKEKYELESRIHQLELEKKNRDAIITRLNIEEEKIAHANERLKKLPPVNPEKERNHLRDKREQLVANLATVSDAIKNLEEELTVIKEQGAVCPVCQRKWTSGQKESTIQLKNQFLIKERNKEQTLITESNLLNGQLEEIEKKWSGWIERKEVLAELEKSKVTHEQLRRTAQQLPEANEKTINELRIRRELIIRTFEKAQSDKEKLEKQHRILQTIDELTRRKSSLNYSETEFETTRKKFELFTEKTSGLEQLLAERKERLKSQQKTKTALEEQWARKKRLETEVIQLEKQKKFFGGMRVTLINVQEKLRTEFIHEINDEINRIWHSLYPYDGFTDARVNAEAGYTVEVKDGTNWIDVEGRVSGGERHIAALSMRIAFASVLAPALSLLLLDEPTHNLDHSAMERLSSSIREQINDMMEQVLLITHESLLEDAITAKLYQLPLQN